MIEKPFHGFTGRILRVDLSTSKIEIEEPSELFYRKYGGCGAMAAYYLLQELSPGTDPLGPENILIIMTGAMNGTALWGANRFLMAAKSPLSLGYGESEAGGWWGPELKFAGFDGIIIKGRASHPVYLWISDGQAEIRDATHIWGKTTGEVQEILVGESGQKRTRVLQCGPAGERGVLYAAVTNELRHWNGRCGMGAVMGSKNLRAIAVRGSGKVDIADEEDAKAVVQWLRETFKRDKSAIHLHGTARMTRILDQDGILPTRNFRQGSFEKADEISGFTMSDTILRKRGTCYSCGIACKREVAVPELGVVPEYGGPEYETLGALGSMCGVGDLGLIAKGNQLCGMYGLDTISTGVCISFAMECFEKGVIDLEDTGGLDLCFGNGAAMLAMIEKIAKREGLGNILADGVARAAANLGPEAQKFALHVKKQEVPMHEPRGKRSLALAYAVSPTGADHMENPHDTLFEALGPRSKELGPLGLIEPLDRLDLTAKKVRAFYITQMLWNMYNVIGMCAFVGTPNGPLLLPKLVDYYSAVTGWQTSLYEMMALGERAACMYRVFNKREGFSAADDVLPARFFAPLENGVLAGEKLDQEEFQKAKRLYYQMAGWDADTGEPTKAKLLELGLDWLL